MNETIKDCITQYLSDKGYEVIHVMNRLFINSIIMIRIVKCNISVINYADHDHNGNFSMKRIHLNCNDPNFFDKLLIIVEKHCSNSVRIK